MDLMSFAGFTKSVPVLHWILSSREQGLCNTAVEPPVLPLVVGTRCIVLGSPQTEYTDCVMTPTVTETTNGLYNRTRVVRSRQSSPIGLKFVKTATDKNKPLPRQLAYRTKQKNRQPPPEANPPAVQPASAPAMLKESMSVTDEKELLDLSKSLSTDFDKEAGSLEND